MEEGQPEQTVPVEVEQGNWFGRHPIIVGMIAIIVIIIAALGILFFQTGQEKIQEIQEEGEEIQRTQRLSNLSSEEILENLELIDVIYYKDGEKVNLDKEKLSETHLDCFNSHSYNESTGLFSGAYVGLIRNKGNYLIDSVKVEVEFFDIEGNLIGTHFNLIDDLEPGEERQFTEYITDLPSEFRTCATNIPSSTEQPFNQNP